MRRRYQVLETSFDKVSSYMESQARSHKAQWTGSRSDSTIVRVGGFFSLIEKLGISAHDIRDSSSRQLMTNINGHCAF